MHCPAVPLPLTIGRRRFAPLAVFAVAWLKTKVHFGNLLKDVCRRAAVLTRSAKRFALSKLRRQALPADPVEMTQNELALMT